MPWNDLPMPRMPDLSELVMRWLGDWPEDSDKSTSSKNQNETRRRKKLVGNLHASRSPKLFDCAQVQSVSAPASVADNAADIGSRPSASRIKKRNKRKK